MGRSQRHLIATQNANSSGEVSAQGEIAPAVLQQVDPGTGLRGNPDPSNAPPDLSGVQVPIGAPGGPLAGSSLMGAMPESVTPPEPPEPPDPALAPTLTSLDPNTAELGSADFTLRCLGSKFTEASVIYFAGQAEPIVFVSPEEITTVIKPSLGWGAVTVQVYVLNADGQIAYPALDFTFTEAAPASRSKKRKTAS